MQAAVPVRMAAMRRVLDAKPQGAHGICDAVLSNADTFGLNWADCPACNHVMDFYGKLTSKRIDMICRYSGCGKFSATLRVGR